MARVRLDIEVDAKGNVTAITKAEDALNDLDKGGKRAAASLEKVRKAQDKLANGAIIAGGAIVAGSYMAVQAASDLEESVSKVGVVFEDQADDILKWSENSAKGLGMSRRAALEAAGTYGNLFTASGMAEDAAADMSKATVELAADLASFNNLDPEETLVKLRSGLTGEIEPLKQLGAQFTQAEMKAKALELGLGAAGRELTEGEKIQARYALILEKTTKAQGDFARTSEGIANSQRIMKAEIEDATASIGTALQPAMKALLGAAVPVAETLGNIAQTKLGQWAIVAGAGLGALALGAGVAHKAIGTVRDTVAAARLVMEWMKGSLAGNTLALQAETGALGANTQAQLANAGAARSAGAARATRGGAAGAGGAGAGGALAGVGVGGATVIAGMGMAWGGEHLKTARQAEERGTLGTIGQAVKTNIKYSNPVTAALGVTQMIAPMLGIGQKAGDELENVGKGAAAASDELAGHSLTSSAQAASMSLTQLAVSGNVLGRAQQGMMAATVPGAEMAISARGPAGAGAGAGQGRVDRIMLEVKGDSMAAEALAKELSRHPEIVAAINERIERASAP